MSIKLPSATGISCSRNRRLLHMTFRLPQADGAVRFHGHRHVLHHGFVSVSLGAIGLRFAEDVDILRQAEPHAGPILALFCPAQPISLVVLTDNVGDDGLGADVGKAVLAEMKHGFRTERTDGLEAEACEAAGHDPILAMDHRNPARLEDAEQFRRQKIHLTEEMLIIIRVPEIVVAGRVFVLRRERN